MKRLILSILSIGILIGLSECSSNPKDNLQNSVNEYSQCMINNDFKCQGIFLDPAPFERKWV